MRTILHVDMDAFFAAVEQRDRPELRGKPVVVGGDRPRGVVSAASYEARRFGCHSAQPIAVAKRRCPNVVVVAPRMGRYREVSTRVFAIFESFTPLLEPLSIDEAFLDVSGCLQLFGSAAAIGRQIRVRIRDTLKLTASVGIGPNKLIAKLASERNKPDGLCEVAREQVRSWLAPMPVRALWGVGPKRAKQLEALRLYTVGDLQARGLEGLRLLLGQRAEDLWRLCNGVDERPVVTAREAKSMSEEHTFVVDESDTHVLEAVLLGQVEHVAWRLRRAGLLARTVTLKTRSSTFETHTHSHTLDSATDSTQVLWEAIASLFHKWSRKHPGAVRLIGAGASSLSHGRGQLDLFANTQEQHGCVLDAAADAIRERYGLDSVRRAGALRSERDS